MNRLREKTTATLLIAIFMISTLAVIVPAMAKPQSITVSFNQAQFQWRATAEFGDWSYTYLEYAVDEDYKLSGNVLHTYWTYLPYVDDEEGAPTVYVYNKHEKLWIEREGRVSYIYPTLYGEYRAYNFFRGYLDFDGDEPSDETFVHGIAYQWCYIYAPEDDAGVTDILPYAQWDDVVEAWLVGFSIYLWDQTPQNYNLAFPDTIPEPVPGNIYNHLEL